MHITVGPGEEYEFKLESLMASEMIAVKRSTSFPGKPELWTGLMDEDPEAWQALVWILRRRAGYTAEKLSETDFPIGACRIRFDAAETERIAGALGVEWKPDPEEFPTGASPNGTSSSPNSASTPGTTEEALSA